MTVIGAIPRMRVVRVLVLLLPPSCFSAVARCSATSTTAATRSSSRTSRWSRASSRSCRGTTPTTAFLPVQRNQATAITTPPRATATTRAITSTTGGTTIGAGCLVGPKRTTKRAPPSATTTFASSRRLASVGSDAENGDDDGDDRDEDTPVDMRYVPRNVKRQYDNYVKLRRAGGKDVVHDVYARDPGDPDDTFWFVGKVARITDVSLRDCVRKQYPLILQHAAQLRPLELWPVRRAVELWATVPGDSELDVAYNRRGAVEFVKIPRPAEVPPIKNAYIGFQGEVYDPGEEGFRTWRDPVDGEPLRPEISAGPSDPAASTAAGAATGSRAERRQVAAAASRADSDPLRQQQGADARGDDRPEGQFRAPTDDEMERIDEMLRGRDINALYEEQERRRKQRGDDAEERPR